MDKYHIYEEIGRGGCSQVFKGREKQKIDYVAIKRVDKLNMSKIVNEVQIMHKLQNPHILRFHDWYETKNNLWLILEYCTGADLKSLLLQDNHLPESSLRIFALDILSGLKYMHGLGIVHCDIRPKNFLIDEHGIVKFSNFKYARKVSKISASIEDVTLKGCPPFMAPELFLANGVHSYASDFWSFGCILYVFRRGCLPWTEDISPENLADLINTKSFFDVDDSFPSMSAELVDLISWLVERKPYHRCQWETLCSHPFWGASSIQPPPSIPANPAYDAYIKHDQKTLHDQFESQVIATINKESASLQVHVPIQQINTPIRSKSSPASSLPPSSTKKPELQADDVLIATPSHARNDYDSKTSWHPADHDDEAIDHHHQQQHHHNRHTEYLMQLSTFDDKVDDGSSIIWTTCEDLAFHTSDFQVKPIIGNKSIEMIEKLSYAGGLPFNTLSIDDIIRLPQSELESHLTHIYKTISRSASSMSSTLQIPSNQTSLTALNNINNCIGYLGTICASAEISNIVLNTSFLHLLLKIVQLRIGSQPMSITRGERYNDNLSPSSTSISSHKMTSALTSLLVATKVTIVTILGTMLRFSTFVLPPQGKQKDDHILSVFLRLLSSDDVNIKLKRRVVGALGEMLFYVTAQDESPEKNAESEKWFIPPIHDLMIQFLLDEDEIVRHYAAKTIENILAQGNAEYKSQLIRDEILKSLIKLLFTCSSENIQTTYATAINHLLFHIVKSSGHSIQRVAMILSALNIPAMINILCEGHNRLQSSILSIINCLFLNSTFNQYQHDDSKLKNLRKSFLNAKFLQIIGRIVEISNMAMLRAKALLCIQFICRYSPSLLINLSESRIGMVLSRLLETSKGFPNRVSPNPNPRPATPSTMDQIAASYLVDTSLSMIRFLRFVAATSLNALTQHIKSYATLISTHDMRDDVHGASSHPNHHDNEEILEYYASILAGVLALINSQGSLRREFFSQEAACFGISLVHAVATFEKLRSDVNTHSVFSSEKDISSTLLLCIESIAKIDFEERMLDNKMTDEGKTSEFELIRVVTALVFPIMMNFTASRDPETRVVVVSCIRNMLFKVIKAMVILYQHVPGFDLHHSIADLMDRFFDVIPQLMEDFSPIPQYVTHIINDLLEIPADIVHHVVTARLQQLPAEYAIMFSAQNN